MHSERPAVADFFRRVGEHRVAGRIPDRLSDALQDDETGNPFPARCQSERWHREHLHEVAEDCDLPEIAGSVRPPPRDLSQAVTEQFAESGACSTNAIFAFHFF